MTPSTSGMRMTGDLLVTAVPLECEDKEAEAAADTSGSGADALRSAAEVRRTAAGEDWTAVEADKTEAEGSAEDEDVATESLEHVNFLNTRLREDMSRRKLR